MTAANERSTPMTEIKPEDVKRCRLSKTDFTSMLDIAKIDMQAWNGTIFNKFIKGTPLENDIPVWMVTFSQRYIKNTRTPDPTLLADIAKLREALRTCKYEEHYNGGDCWYDRQAVAQALTDTAHYETKGE